MKTLILGKRSFISKNLIKKISHSEIYTIDYFVKNISKILLKKKYNLIINSFYPTKKLNDITNYEKFIDQSSMDLSKLLDHLPQKKINKIIYTSSSSIYGLKKNEFKFNEKINRNIYAAYKLSSEEMIKNFTNKNRIKLLIARVFNVYGNTEDFSIISRLKKIHLKKNKTKLKVNNKGSSIRDFIHIDDLVKIYSTLIKSNHTGVYDIGTGKGIKISDIIDNLKITNKNILYPKNKVNEIDFSIADIAKLKKITNIEKFKKLENFFYKKDTKKKLNFYKYFSLNNINLSVGSVIYGAGFSGKRIAKHLLSLNKFNVAYFVDDDDKKIGTSLMGINIISFSQLKIFAKKSKVPNIIVAIPSMSYEKNVQLLEKLYPLSWSISNLPQKKYFKNKAVEMRDLEEIPLQEILNRDIFTVNLKTLNNFNNKTILITGGAGSIGSEINRQLLKSKPKKIMILDHSEFNIFRLNQKTTSKKVEFILGDIKDENFLTNLIKTNKVDYIFHAAAYKHVKFLEENVISAINNNIFGTLSVLKSIKKTSINAIFISTDKAVFPKNVLGLTKRISEVMVQLSKYEDGYDKAKLSIVRFGNVLGSDGSAIPTFVDQIKRDLPITITDKRMERYFMSIKEACSLVIESSQLKTKNNIFILKMGKQIKIIDIVKKIFEFLKKPNQKFNIKIIGKVRNEKISERLSYSTNIKKTKIKKIFIANDKVPNYLQFKNFLKDLKVLVDQYESKKSILVLKKFLNVQ